MNCFTNSSVPNEERSSPASSHHAKTAYACMFYQASIWYVAFRLNHLWQTRKRNGWKTEDDGHLVIQWMHSPPAPDAALELLSCKCMRSCKLPNYTCLVNGLACTNICKLQMLPLSNDYHIKICPIDIDN